MDVYYSAASKPEQTKTGNNLNVHQKGMVMINEIVV